MNQQIQDALARLHALKRLSSRHKLNAFVGEAAFLTGSKLSYFAVINDAGNTLIMLGWSRSAMDACSMLDKPVVYPLAQTGVWGDCIREHKPIIINDYPGCTKVTKKGYPDGHVSVIRHANLPIWEGSQMVGLIGVGNKETDYCDEDMEVLSTFAHGAWDFVKKEIVDMRCHYSSICPFFRRTMPIHDAMFTTNVEKYCEQAGQGCALFIIIEKKGFSEIPKDLYPNQTFRLQDILGL